MYAINHSKEVYSLVPRPRPAFRHFQYVHVRGEPGDEARRCSSCNLYNLYYAEQAGFVSGSISGISFSNFESTRLVSLCFAATF